MCCTSCAESDGGHTYEGGGAKCDTWACEMSRTCRPHVCNERVYIGIGIYVVLCRPGGKGVHAGVPFGSPLVAELRARCMSRS